MYEKFERLLKSKGVTVADVCRATGIRHSSLSDWKTGKSQPKADKLQKIANYFGVSVEYFTTVHTDGQPTAYYLNKETADIAQEVFDNPDLRILFDAARDAKPENLKLAAEMLRRFKEGSQDG